MSYDNILSPINIGTQIVKNRIALAPMGTSLQGPNGTVTKEMVDYFEARARGGTGMIISPFTSVDDRYRAITIGLHSPLPERTERGGYRKNGSSASHTSSCLSEPLPPKPATPAALGQCHEKDAQGTPPAARLLNWNTPAAQRRGESSFALTGLPQSISPDATISHMSGRDSC